MQQSWMFSLGGKRIKISCLSSLYLMTHDLLSILVAIVAYESTFSMGGKFLFCILILSFD